MPLIIVPPKKPAEQFSAGSRCDLPVSLVELYPTLVELCEVVGPGALDGQSLVPLLRDPSQQAGRAVVTMFDRGNASLRTDRWRLIRYADGSAELYDLSNDPHEWNNLADLRGHDNVRQTLNGRLDQAMSQEPNP